MGSANDITEKTITLYDIPSNPNNGVKNVAWSPNVWKARFALNIKGLSYHTTWVEYPDIKPLSIHLGAQPSACRSSGPFYTLPLISDPHSSSLSSQPTLVSDSFKIAQYLDVTYPSSGPMLIPPGTAALQKTFADTVQDKVILPIFQYINPKNMQKLNERSALYWRATKEQVFKTSIEKIAPPGSDKAQGLWEAFLSGLSVISGWMGENTEGGGVFLLGEEPSFADTVIVAALIWTKMILGENSDEWKEVVSEGTDSGRWARVMKEFGRWEVVDESGLKQLKEGGVWDVVIKGVPTGA